MMQSLVAPDYLTLEACYSRASKSPLNKIFFDRRHFMCVFLFMACLCFARCYPSACVAQERV